MPSIRTNPDVIRWAMIEAGLDPGEFFTDFPELEKWLAKSHSIEFSTLKLFSSRTEIPFGVLMLSKVPTCSPKQNVPSRASLSESSIVSHLARRVVDQLLKKVIRDFRQSGFLTLREDVHTMLDNGWDELCVVVHLDGIACGDRYDEAIKLFVRCSVEGLESFELEAVWLQTDEGDEWDCEEPEDREPYPVFSEDVVRYVAEMVTDKARESSNPRVRKCIAYRYETG